MKTSSLISILSLLFLALSVFGKSTPNLRRALSTDIESLDIETLAVEDEKEKRILVCS